MKSKYLSKWMLPVAASGLMLVAGCVVTPDGRVAFQPVVVAPAPVVVAPAPPPVVVADPGVVLVPDNYVWDGVEFVGFVGGSYVYLGPDHVWIRCDDVRLGRFHDYERFHPDWRAHAVVNVDYRRDRYGHEAPRRDHEPSRQGERKREEKRDDRRDDHHQ